MTFSPSIPRLWLRSGATPCRLTSLISDENENEFNLFQGGNRSGAGRESRPMPPGGIESELVLSFLSSNDGEMPTRMPTGIYTPTTYAYMRKFRSSLLRGCKGILRNRVSDTYVTFSSRLIGILFRPRLFHCGTSQKLV